MKRITTLLLTFTLTFITTLSFAQHQHSERCGHNILINSMEEKYPGFNDAVSKTFEEAKVKGAELRANGRAEVLTIPIAFHVVWHEDSPEQNIADSIVMDQLRVLNEDYRMLNSDAGNLRSEFDGLAGDAEIEFSLHGIIRVQTTQLFEPGLTGLDDSDQVKSTINGGSDALSPSNILNVWICELQPLTLLGIPLGEILGYAYPPAGLANWPAGASAPTPDKDGVVLDYRTIGSNNPTSTHFTGQGFSIIGRTATHEVGHYLGLRHVWGDPDPLSGQDGCTVDDGVDDTPNAASNNQQVGCIATANSCGAGTPGDLPDMWENYMDYSQETCQVTFTVGQVDIMRGVLAGPRSGLLEELTCTAPTTGAVSGSNSVDVSSVESYAASNSSNTFTWTVTGGAITSGTGTNSITVTWDSNPGMGEVCLTESEDACIGDTKCLSVTKSTTCSNPTTGTISGAATALTSTAETYSAPTSSNIFDWTVTGGVIASGAGTNSIQVNWSTGVAGQVCLIESDGACEGNEECLDVTLSTPTGIVEVAYNKGLSIFPNPANSFINVRSNEVPIRIELIDVLGKVLTSNNNPSLNNHLNIARLSTNIIFVKVYFEEGFALEKIVVQ